MKQIWRDLVYCGGGKTRRKSRPWQRRGTAQTATRFWLTLIDDDVAISAPFWTIQKLRWSLRCCASKGTSGSSWGEAIRRRETSEDGTVKQQNWNFCFRLETISFSRLVSVSIQGCCGMQGGGRCGALKGWRASCRTSKKVEMIMWWGRCSYRRKKNNSFSICSLGWAGKEASRGKMTREVGCNVARWAAG
jgi:hypothetical protein